MAEQMDIDDEETYWRGNSMDQIYRGLGAYELKHFPEVTYHLDHTVLYHLPIRNTTIPPVPYKCINKWDADHVRLPCSRRNQYPVQNADGVDELQDRWILIETALLKEINTSYELEAAILSYNTKYMKTWNFKGLHRLFNEEIEEEESKHFFKHLLPEIIKLALRLPEICPGAIPLLKQGTNHSVSFTQQQISCLLANAFLCTFPRRNSKSKTSEYRSFPDINFNRLFFHADDRVMEKLKCICNYFRRVCSKPPSGVVTVTRRCVNDAQLPNWSEWKGNFAACRVHVSSAGTIEDQGHGLLQVDFANKYLGGGVLGRGCVQEEIRFVICPELLITRLLVEFLQSNEAVVVVGCEQYNDYSGYSDSFKWKGNFVDEAPFDESRRRQCCIVAIDALNFHRPSDQFKVELLKRELDKAYVGFFHNLKTPAPGVATGNWGCGAFKGDTRLKALLQLMVCCITARPLVYYTFGDRELRDDFIEFFKFLVEHKLSVATLWQFINDFRQHNLKPAQLYAFIYQAFHDSLLPKEPKQIKVVTPAKSQKTAQTYSPTPSTSKWAWPKSRKNASAAIAQTFLSDKQLQDEANDETSPSEPQIPIIEPKETPKITKLKLLDCLDQQYYQKNNSAIEEVIESNETPATITIENELKKEPIGDNSDDSPMQTANVYETLAVDDTTTLVSDDDEVIPATPPPPPESSSKRKKFVIVEQKQKKLSDYFARK